LPSVKELRKIRILHDYLPMKGCYKAIGLGELRCIGKVLNCLGDGSTLTLCALELLTRGLESYVDWQGVKEPQNVSECNNGIL
jgi:hypothetical protein